MSGSSTSWPQMKWYRTLWIVCAFAAKSEPADDIECTSKDIKCLVSTALKKASIASTSRLPTCRNRRDARATATPREAGPVRSTG
ncbi:hypothetical protein C8J57DRAFT_1331184 [Mycena rebaudengoi]|nr:hypothetical protein C8J57DRAFT_1331184 [Mycena rebaudengoi]